MIKPPADLKQVPQSVESWESDCLDVLYTIHDFLSRAQALRSPNLFKWVAQKKWKSWGLLTIGLLPGI